MSESQYTGGSAGPFSFSFESYQASDVKVSVDGIDKTVTTHYTISNYTTSGGGQVTFTSGNVPTGAQTIRIYRQTDVAAMKATFAAGSSIKSEDLNNNFKQLRLQADEAVGPNQISNHSITSAKIKDGSIETVDIKDANVTTAKLADSAVTTAKIAGDAVDGTKIADNSINSEHYVDGSIDTAHIADAQITTAKIADDAVTADKLANTAVSAGSYTAANITVDAQGRVTAASNGAIGTSEITDAAVTTAKLASDSVTSAKIVDGSIVNADINASAAIDGSKLNVELNDLSNVSVASPNTDELLKWNGTNWIPGSVSGAGTVTNIATGTGLTGGPITSSGTVSVASGGIDTTQLADDAVTAAKLEDTAVTAGSYGSSTSIPSITVDAQGRITAASGNSISTDLVDDTTPQLGGNLDVQAREINTSTTDGNIKLAANGTGVVEIRGNTNAGAIVFNCESNSHGVTIKGPAHSAGATYTLTLPTSDGDANQILSTDGSGVLSWVAKPEGAVGGGTDNWAVEHDNTITSSYTISTGKNVINAGPMTVNSGATVTVPSGSTWTIV